MNAPTGDVLATREHLRALHTIRWWRSFFVFFALLAVFTHLGAWAAAEFGNVFEASRTQAESDRAAGHEGSSDATAAVVSRQWGEILEGALPLAEVFGRCAIVGLVLTILLGALVVLSGRLSGVSDIIRAFYVAVIAGLLFVPWQRLSMQAPSVPGVFTTVERLKSTYHPEVRPANGESFTVGGVNLGPADTWTRIKNGGRYCAFPLLAVIFIIAAGSRFGRAYRLAASSQTTQVQMRIT